MCTLWCHTCIVTCTHWRKREHYQFDTQSVYTYIAKMKIRRTLYTTTVIPILLNRILLLSYKLIYVVHIKRKMYYSSFYLHRACHKYMCTLLIPHEYMLRARHVSGSKRTASLNPRYSIAMTWQSAISAAIWHCDITVPSQCHIFALWFNILSLSNKLWNSRAWVQYSEKLCQAIN